MTIPPAAQQLISQVQALNSDATYEVTGGPDGFGVYREIEFDKDTAKWLVPVLKVIEDERIQSMELRGGKAKKLAITFVGNIRADYRFEYPLQEVLDVLNGED